MKAHQQNTPINFSPIDCQPADEFVGELRYAVTWRGGRPWGYNPWTGCLRNAADIEADPYGCLIIPPGEPLYVGEVEDGADLGLISGHFAEHPLFPLMLDVLEQVMFGKGKRHGGAETPFLKQPWAHYAKMHGRGFLTGQAAKKLEEATTGKEGEAFDREMFGAVVYTLMAVLHDRAQRQETVAK